MAGLLGIAAGLRWLSLPWSGPLFPAAPFFPALMMTAAYAGWRWGLLAVVISGGLVWELLVSGMNPTAREAFGLGLFIVSAVVCVLAAATLRRAVLSLRELSAAKTAAERSLEESQARLQLAQDVGGVGLWDWDLHTGEGYWSDAVYRNIGLAPSVPPSFAALRERIHPDDRQYMRDIGRRVAQGHWDAAEYRVLMPDGSIRWLLSRGQVMRDAGGKPVRAVGVNIDVTERRLAEEAVRESEARFRALADSAPALMWISRLGGQREFVNRTYVEFVGGTYEDALNLDWRDRLEPHDLSRVLKEQIAGEASMEPFTLEARYLRADGQWRWIRSFSQPRHGPDGAFQGFIGIGFDVTQAKQAQADLTRINDLLAERVEAVLTERDQAQAALSQSQKMEALGQLTGGVAHDFNNLLTVIIGALDIVRRRPDDAARTARLTEAAITAAHRGEKLTQQLLAFSRRQPLRPEVMCVDEMLRESETLYRRALGEQAALELRLSAGEARARLDAAQFEAALLNLLVNARDALRPGGHIRIETATIVRRETRDEIEAGDYISVAVCDDGAGMDAQTMTRVFEPFFTTKAVGKGTGLGLSQVYGFARQTGGGVEIESRLGQGTCVRMLLPASRAAAPRAEPPARARPAVQRALHVLLVEDDPQVAATVEAMLHELGHTVVIAGSVEDALQVVGKEPRIGLVLTDVIMPGGKTGVDLAVAVTRQRPGLPVVLSSGYTGAALAQAEAAPWPLLRKPYPVAALAEAISEAVENPRRSVAVASS